MNKADNPNSYNHIVKYTGLFGGVQGLNILIGVLRNKLVATILGPTGMGLIALFNSTIKLVSDTTNLGIQMSAVRNISEIYESGNEEQRSHIVKLIRSWSLITAVAGMLLCIVLSPILSYWTFGWGDHTLHFILLSPVVALMAITGGEMALLKGARQLKRLAVVSVYNVIAALVTSIPIYYFFGESGIVPSLIIMALFQMLFTVMFSYRIFPLRLSANKMLLREGIDMVHLGIAFVVAGILGSGAEFAIRSYLSYTSTLEMLGLFSAGYMMTMTYSGMVFSAMETDYFPRLSAAKDNVRDTNLLVNRQMEVSLLLIAPILVAFTIGLPILIPLLYSGKFFPVMGMMQVMVIAMYMRAVKLPVAYLPLAKGDSKSYLMLEAIYDVVVVILVFIAFRLWGLTGCGIAITVAGLFDLLIIIGYARYKYQYRCSSEIKRYMAIQFPIGILAYMFTFIETPLVYWSAGILLTIISGGISYELLRKNSVKLPDFSTGLGDKEQKYIRNMKVSVLVAVYNAEQYLDKCLNSLLSQTLGDIEVVCVDDASTDSSLQILRRYEAGDSRIKVVALEHNTGLAHARNVALREAEGEYICMLDADDWYSDDALEKAATILDNNADIDCVLFRLCYYCDDKRQDFFAMKEFTTMTGTEAMKHSIEWDGVHGIYMIRAEIHHRFPYDETTRVYSDENTARLHFAAARNVGLCDGIYYYRQHEKSVTHDVNSSYTDRIMATQSLLTSLIGTGIDKETEQRLYDKLWLTVVDGLYFVYNNRKRLSANDRKECMDKIVKAWQATDPKKISDTLRSKFGYMPMKQSWMLFLAEERLYFFLKKLKG